MKLIEGDDHNDQAVLDELHKMVTKRGLKVRAVDGHGHHCAFMAPEAVGVQFVGPYYRYKPDVLVRPAATNVGVPFTDELLERVMAEILAKARGHAMKGDFE